MSAFDPKRTSGLQVCCAAMRPLPGRWSEPLGCFVIGDGRAMKRQARGKAGKAKLRKAATPKRLSICPNKPGYDQRTYECLRREYELTKAFD
jgi:hypothetical protein